MGDFLRGAVFALLVVTVPLAGYSLFTTQASAQACQATAERSLGLLASLVGARR